ncbi:hypothetical protein GFK26_29390 [Variovorax paradoxus]|uniref:Uncharacterized protein n=1 Tax=Variovorax paradoxus TaxID=34073 RepID=A0A5Q0MD69_VARPD|nr:hypothetical protein [Variovorax paradoxus]QFZ86594.1 hypothetical protein GFK26_29390 [Variovorax paradoxus]
MSTRKGWRDRLAGYPNLPNVKAILPAMRAQHGKGTIATPSPAEVEEAMRDVPEGRLATVFGIGEEMAERHHATIRCTATTAIFARMVVQRGKRYFVEDFARKLVGTR